jgi:hypothetical protein
VVRSCTRLHTDLRSRRYKAVKFLQPLPSAQALLPHRLVTPIYAVKLKYVLCQVHADTLNLHLGFLLILTGANDITSLALDAD